ncbi:MAG TPA: hypothetical protein DCF73_13015, partial [Rhodobiaceae bacterium]|nr:hypothetical protein [Rhodobiaceae bacterium]
LNNDPFDPATRRRVSSSFPGYIHSTAPVMPEDELFREIERQIAEEEEVEEAQEEMADVMSPAGNAPIKERIRSTFRNLGWKSKPEKELMRRVIGGDQREPGIASVMLASLNIVQDRLARMRMAGDPPDIMIAPKVGHLSLLDFDRADELIRLGEEAAEEAIPQIREIIALVG